MIEPPQKWKLAADLNDTWYGNCPEPAFEPPTMNPSHSENWAGRAENQKCFALF
jgi:hypothetical protein